MRFAFTLALTLLLAPLARAQAPKPWSPTTRPAQPVGVWCQPVGNFDLWKARGINTLLVPETENGKYTPVQWAAEAEKRGMWVVGEFGDARPPNLLAWFLKPDEADAKGYIPLDQLKAEADRLRKIDPTVPVYASLSGQRITSAGARDFAWYQGLAAIVDIASEDWYVYSTNPGRYPVSFKGDAVRRLKGWGFKSVWTIAEAGYQRLPQYAATSRELTADEFEANVMHPVIAGADGVGYFATAPYGSLGWPGSWDAGSPAVTARLTQVNARLSAWRAGLAWKAPTVPDAQGPTTVPTTQPVTDNAPPGTTTAAQLAEIAAGVRALREQAARGFDLAAGGRIVPVPPPATQPAQ